MQQHEGDISKRFSAVRSKSCLEPQLNATANCRFLRERR
jgi:hypothetical protein